MIAYAGRSTRNPLQLYLERTQTTQTRAHARSDQSLSLAHARDLLPQPLCGR